MPLSPMDANIQETEAAGRKRSHTEFAEDSTATDGNAVDNASAPAPLPASQTQAHSSPQASPAMTDAGCSTPGLPASPSPQTPSKPAQPTPSNSGRQSTSPAASAPRSTATTQPVIKRKRLTAQEKEDRDKEAAEKKREREIQAAARAAEKAKQEEEKAARAKEREEKRRKKEDEDRVKAEKKRKKEEEQRRAQEEKEKKERSQTKLNNFFSLPGTPKKPATGPSRDSESPGGQSLADKTAKPTLSVYEKLFKPFYVRENTRWTASAAGLDEETREARSRALDDFISGRRVVEKRSAGFDAVELLRLPGKTTKRGRQHHPVKHIMEKVYKQVQKLGDSSAAATGNALESARQRLAKVPIKIIAFSQDVRPPYYGTITYQPFALGMGNMYRAARRTSDRRLPLDYEYDSEAEWQEEEGEDVDVDDDEEEQDDEDDMDGFLDDSEDAGLSRPLFANTMEPQSTGICFEGSPDSGSGRVLAEHSMEFVHDGLKRTCGIDPWSTQYWEPEPKRNATKNAKAAGGGGAVMAPPPAPGSAFDAPASSSSGPEPKLVKAELLDDVKRLILANKELSKMSVIDIIFHQ
ncbi:hypothetical protein CDD83_5033 [Cordyceps sp. RAO-2017]|nr:hypothetical protein CDD83_5033 [Cordyceps sp. RAO-2017]